MAREHHAPRPPGADWRQHPITRRPALPQKLVSFSVTDSPASGQPPDNTLTDVCVNGD